MTWSLASPTAGLGIPGDPSPVLADFTAFNTAIAPRALDLVLFLQDLDTEPIYYSAYKTWATSLGVTMVSTMSPSSHKLSDFTSGSFDTSGLNSGGLHSLALDAAAVGGPIILRLAHEFNGGFGSYGRGHETAAAFVAAWRHIHGVFVAAGATNVLWFWCPNIWDPPGGSSPAVDPTIDDGSGSTWYPGDAYVDIIGLDGYMMTANPIVNTPADLFLANYATLTAAIPTKPFAIGEFGVAAQSRLSSIGGKAGWYALLFDMIKNHMPTFSFACQWQRSAGPDDTTISSSGSDAAAAAAFETGILSAPFAISPRSVGFTLPLSGSIATPAEPKSYTSQLYTRSTQFSITLARTTAAGGMLVAHDRDELALDIGHGLGLGSPAVRVRDITRTTSVVV